jgi:O-Antigen ligase/Virulence factor membrane-bound polymerase, C-terminal
MRSLFLFIGLAGLFLGWNMPNHYPLWTAFHGEFVAATGVCILFIGVMWFKATSTSKEAGTFVDVKRSPLALPLPVLVWVLLALLAPMQYLIGRLDFYGDALLGFLYALGVAMSLYTGCMWAARAGRAAVLRALFLTLLCSALAAAGIAFWQWVRLPTPGWWVMDLIETRPYGNFAQPNLFGLSMVMGIVAATALFEMGELLHRVSYAFVLMYLGCGLIISESRAALLAATVVALFWFTTHKRVATRLRWYEVGGALAAGWVLTRLLPNIEDALYLKTTIVRNVLDVGPREAIWLHFWGAIREHPWLGYGFNQGVLALRDVAAYVQPSRNTIYAHNVVLDLMTWFGIPVALLLSAALAGWMLSWLRRRDGDNSDVGFAAQRHHVFAIWLALALQSLLEFPFAHAFFLLPAALLAGAIMTVRIAPALGPAKSVRPSYPAVALAALAATLLALTGWDYLQFETEFRANRFDKGKIGVPAQHEPHSGPVMLDQLALLNACARIEARRGMPTNDIDQLGRLAKRFHLLPSRIEYAKALALNGRAAEAQAELQMVRGVYHPDLWAQIERDWFRWQTEHRTELPPTR